MQRKLIDIPSLNPGIKQGSLCARFLRLFQCSMPTLVLVLSLDAPFHSLAASGDIVIDEILYHPAADNSGDEFLELFNRGDAPVDLSGWRLSTAIDYTFPACTMLGPGDYLVVARNSAAAQSFYGISNLVGNFSGRLDN